MMKYVKDIVGSLSKVLSANLRKITGDFSEFLWKNIK